MSDCCANVRGSECHCGRCHMTFSALYLFDRHQKVDYSADGPGRVSCMGPGGLGLVPDARGTWRTPQALETNKKRAARARGRNKAASGSSFG